eukprot:gb/GFBE01021211.1/.p1 GENE.gb/GFBE01021211.1/~~gb/GFBE01021211.1/.p1  ORF type:complete len:123 (+),score=19.56 gb/GFBE01021211.1/:3-371(+)
MIEVPGPATKNAALPVDCKAVRKLTRARVLASVKAYTCHVSASSKLEIYMSMLHKSSMADGLLVAGCCDPTCSQAATINQQWYICETLTGATWNAVDHRFWSGTCQRHPWAGHAANAKALKF